MSIRVPYAKLVLVTGIFIFICAVLAAAAFAATPAFTAHKNGTNQTVANDTDTLLTWSTEGFDTNNNFATNRFTPTVAGKYLIVVSVHCQQAGYCMPAIRKNGTTIIARAQVMETTVGQTPSVTAIVDMNGTTDYVEAMATSSGTVIAGTIERTYFSGSQIDGAGSGGSSQWTDGTAGAIYYNSGNVGIGEANPPEVLSIEGTNPAIFLMEGATAGIKFKYDDAANSLGVIGRAASVDTTLMTITRDSGNVGIGVSSPGEKLDVAGALRLQSTTADGSLKASYLVGGHYTNAEEAFGIVGGVGGNGFNSVLIGSTGGAYNAATAIQFFTTANNTTLTGTERVRIDPNGNVGIGTTSPAERLHVAGAVKVSGSAMSSDTASAGGMDWFGSGTRFFSWGVSGPTKGTFQWIQKGADGSAQYPVTIANDGNVGIGTTSPAARLQVAGNIRIDSPVNATAGRTVCMNVNGDFHALSASTCYASDARLKKNIHTLASGQLERVAQLRGVSFEWKSPEDWRPGEQIGLIAQEVEKVFPQVVSTDANGRKSVDYQWLVAPLIEAVKELKADNDNLRAELRETIESQDSEIDELRRQIEAMRVAQ